MVDVAAARWLNSPKKHRCVWPRGSPLHRLSRWLVHPFGPSLRIPTKPATHSNRKPATDSDLKPAGVPI